MGGDGGGAPTGGSSGLSSGLQLLRLVALEEVGPEAEDADGAERRRDEDGHDGDGEDLFAEGDHLGALARLLGAVQEYRAWALMYNVTLAESPAAGKIYGLFGPEHSRKCRKDLNVPSLILYKKN